MNSSQPTIINTPQSCSEPIFLAILAFVQFTHILDFMVIMPQGPMFMQEFGIDTHGFGWLVSSYPIGAALMSFFVSSFLDRYSSKRLLLIFYGLFILTTIGCVFAPNFWVLLVIRFFAGCFGGLLFPLTQTLVGEVIPQERRGHAMGVIMGSFSVSSVLGVPIGLWVVHHSSWHMSFVLVASLSIVAWITAYRWLPMIEKTARMERRLMEVLSDMRAVLFFPAYIKSFLLNILVMAASFSVIPFITIYATNNLSIPMEDIPWVYFFGGVCTFFSARVIGWFTDRYGQGKIFRWVSFCSLAPLMIVTHLKPLPLWEYLMITSIFFVFVSGRAVPLNALFTSVARPETRASFMSMNTTMQHLGLSLASVVSGAILTQESNGFLSHFGQVGWLVFGLTVIAIWLSFSVQKEAIVSAKKKEPFELRPVEVNK
jgi:predicted MFS family arabinose efflux permease